MKKYILSSLAALFFTCNAFGAAPVTLYFISGQFPINAGQLIDGDIGTLTNKAIDNLVTALTAQGLALSNVVQTSVYLTDIRDFAGMDAAYNSRFTSSPQPARNVIEVSNLVYPTRIMISCIARK